jgi:hypothetical protein
VRLDPEDLSLIHNPGRNFPPWTYLDFHQCPNCTLTMQIHPLCPVAASLVDIVEVFESLVSYDRVQVEVRSADKSTFVETSVQQGVGSLMGLIVAASGCPHTAFFRPMARFHAPFADEEETIYRAASMYLLAQYFVKKDGKKADLDLEGLSRIYRQVQVVNEALVQRLRGASETDSALNALILLDLFAKALPDLVDESLKEIRYLFKPFLRADP